MIRGFVNYKEVNIMVALTQKETLEVYNDTNFITQSHYLSNALGNSVTDEEAENMLFLYFTENRLRNWTHQEFIKAWNDNGKYEKGKKNRLYLRWIITFSRKDLVLQWQKRNNNNKDYTDYLSSMYDESNTPNTYSDKYDLLKEALYENKEILFSSLRKRDNLHVIDDLYNNTLNENTLEKDLKYFSKICSVNRRKNKLNNILNDNLNQEKEKELSFINSFLSLEEYLDNITFNDNVSIEDIEQREQELINNNQELFDDIVGRIKGINNQVSLIKDYMNASNSDKVKVIDYMEKRKEYLNDLLEVKANG